MLELHNAALRLSASETVALPIDAAYARATDTAALERRAIRAGADVEREVDDGTLTGTRWLVRGRWRGRVRELRLAVVAARVNESVTVAAASERFDIRMRVIFVPEGDAACRVRVDVALAPSSISGRLMVPALKLGRKRLERRLATALAALARAAEAGHRAGAPRRSSRPA